MKISIELTHAGLTFSAIHNGILVRKRYIGYSRREAMKAFKQYLKTLKD